MVRAVSIPDRAAWLRAMASVIPLFLGKKTMYIKARVPVDLTCEGRAPHPVGM